MITERKLIETVSGSDINNMSLSRVARDDGGYYTSLIKSIKQNIQSLSIDTKSGSIAYQGPVISFSNSMVAGQSISAQAIMRLEYWDSQYNRWMSFVSSSFSMKSTFIPITGSYLIRSFSGETLEGLDYKNVECRMYYEFTISGRDIFSEPLYSLISFNQTLQHVSTSPDKLLSYIFKNVASEIVFTANSTTDGYLGCKVSAKGEATYQPSIIGKVLYF